MILQTKHNHLGRCIPKENFRHKYSFNYLLRLQSQRKVFKRTRKLGLAAVKPNYQQPAQPVAQTHYKYLKRHTYRTGSSTAIRLCTASAPQNLSLSRPPDDRRRKCPNDCNIFRRPVDTELRRHERRRRRRPTSSN